MRKGLKRFFMVLFICVLCSVNAFAGSSGKKGTTVDVPNDSMWHGSTIISRTGNYSYITLWCQYVIPSENGVADNYSTVGVQAKDSSGALIGSKYAGSTNTSSILLTENAANDKKLYLVDGKLGLKTVRLCYRNDYEWVPITARIYYSGN